MLSSKAHVLRVVRSVVFISLSLGHFQLYVGYLDHKIWSLVFTGHKDIMLQ